MEDRDCPRTLPTNSHVILAIQPPYKVGSIVFMSHMRKPQAITSISHYRKRFRGENSPLSRVQARFPHVKAYVPDFLTSNIDGGGISEHPRWHKTYQNCMRTESLPENSCSFYTLHDNMFFFFLLSSSEIDIPKICTKYILCQFKGIHYTFIPVEKTESTQSNQPKLPGSAINKEK